MHRYLYLRKHLGLLCTANSLEIWTSKFESCFYLQILWALVKVWLSSRMSVQIILLDKIAPRAIALDELFSTCFHLTYKETDGSKCCAQLKSVDEPSKKSGLLTHEQSATTLHHCVAT